MASVNFSLLNSYWVHIKSESHPFHFYILSNLDNVESEENGKYKMLLSDFLQHRSQRIFKNFKSLHPIEFFVSDELKELLINRELPEDHENNIEIEVENLNEKLEENNFRFSRLKDFQKRNLKKLCSKPYMADFSVPGAGKTSEALAFYAFQKNSLNSKLLVISPINAFSSWDEEITKNFSAPESFIRLRGNASQIKRLLNFDEEFFIANYEMIRNELKLMYLIDFLRGNDVQICLDESHRIKGPKLGYQISKIAPYAKKKIILTGTPMPQSSDDLVNQFKFLYPSYKVIESAELIKKFQPFYVRTTDDDLNLRPIVRNPGERQNYLVKPYEGQAEFFYQHILNPVKAGKSLNEILQIKNRYKAYMTLLIFLSNPKAQLEFIRSIDASLADQISSEGNGAKIDRVVKRAKELFKENKKVLIWSNFTQNINTLQKELEILGSQFIDGSVPIEINKDDELESEFETAESEENDFDELETREEKINSFKNGNCDILIANPMAAAESMSLHEVCDNALYLDRTYRVDHFLQSEKRIHRLTEGAERTKTVEIFFTKLRGSTDYHVDMRLAKKSRQMFKFLREENLSKAWLEIAQSNFYQSLNDTSEDYQNYEDYLQGENLEEEHELNNYDLEDESS